MSFEYHVSITLIILPNLWKANTGLYQSKVVIEYLNAVRMERVPAIFLCLSFCVTISSAMSFLSTK